MTRIQNLNLQNIITIVFFGLFLNLSARAENIPADLEIADSLFNLRKYTQSFEIYERIVNTGQETSPAMLLKMAYIKEGLGDFSSALYYLNLYYLQTHNKRALRKMEDLAKKYGLTGYDYTDVEFFMNVFYKYYSTIIYVLSAFCIILIGYMVFKKFRWKVNPGFSFFYLIFIIGLLFYVVNYGKKYQKGIIINPETYLMDGPSSGSKLVAIADIGHRVQVLGKEDVWVKIRWEGNPVYVKENNLLEITED